MSSFSRCVPVCVCVGGLGGFCNYCSLHSEVTFLTLTRTHTRARLFHHLDSVFHKSEKWQINENEKMQSEKSHEPLRYSQTQRQNCQNTHLRLYIRTLVHTRSHEWFVFTSRTLMKLNLSKEQDRLCVCVKTVIHQHLS